MQNIQDDLKSGSEHSLKTQSELNQLCMLSNSYSLAAATSTGIEVYDLNQLTLKSTTFEVGNTFNFKSDEVLHLKSM
jgi:hypothetical protein